MSTRFNVSLSKKGIFLITSALTIGLGFYLGILIYPTNYRITSNEFATISVREFAPLLNEATKNDFILWADKNSISIKKSELKKWLEPYVRTYSGKQDLRLSNKEMLAYLSSVAPKLNKDPINAKFNFKNNRAEIFVPSISGKKLNIDQSASIISTALFNNKSSASLIFDLIDPEVTLEKINDLGINTLIAKGESDYGNSPPSRIHNIKTGMNKFNGTILKPNEEFSFNNILGEVDDSSGYQAELVIKNGALVKEFGGGLCQVSTTIFRAAALAGLPITERKPHSFPVQYYNPQGFDSTIYPGVVDLKFVNNTPGHILVQTKVSGGHLSVEIYGSDDGRKVTLTGPFQYDKKPSGAMKAYFTRKISLADGTEKEERFESIYKAPPAHPEERNPLE